MAASHEPFSTGHSMGNNGTIVQVNGLSGRQPWIPACFYADTFRCGIAVNGIDYYDAMDNMESSRIGQVSLGGFWSNRRFVIKASYAYFNALNLYNEQQGYFSAAFTPFRAVHLSAELTGCRAGLFQGNNDHETVFLAGASMLVSRGPVALSLSCGHIPLTRASAPGFESPTNLSAGFYASNNRYGAQGVVCEVTRAGDYAFHFSIGEEYRVSRFFAVAAALSTNPFMMHFGCTFACASSGISLAFVNHPVLGWSKGLTLDYAR